MIDIKITPLNDAELLELIRRLDEELWQLYGDVEEKYAPFNRLPSNAIAVILYLDSAAVGCGALRPMEEVGVGELKRMYVLPTFRNRGVGAQIVSALERVAAAIGMGIIRLETGVLQPEAIRLYEKCGYERIDSYGPYANMTESICLEKLLE